MAFNKTIAKDLIYISYKREDANDYESFKREMTNAASVSEGSKDLIVDFTGSSIITSLEIGILVRLLKLFQGTARMLRLIVPAELQRTFTSTNIQKLSNLAIYADSKALLTSITKPAAK